MSTPPDEPVQRPNPFAPQPQDESPYDSSPPPAPPVMHSPYRPDEALPGQGQGHRERQPPRFPSLFGTDHHGSGHGSHGGHGAQPEQPQAPMTPPPPFEQRSSQGVSANWGMGTGNESYPVPPQFSYNPERQPVYQPPAPAPSRAPRRAIIGVAAIVLVSAGTVGAVLLHGSSAKSTTGGSTVNIPGQDSHTTAGATVQAKWSAPASGDAATVVGSWLVNKKTVVRGDAGALKAYDAETGKQVWTLPVPGQGAAICQMSQVTVQGIGMVQYGAVGNCNTVAAINTANGKTVWTQTLGATPGSAPGTMPMMAMGADMVAGQIGTTVTAWNAADGKQLWTSDLAKAANPPCKPDQLAAKSTFVALIEDCGAGPVAVRKDAHTGADLWRTPLPPEGLNGAQITLVEAALPTIVHVESPTLDNYYTFDAQGKAKATIPGSGDFGKLNLNVGPQTDQQQLPHVQDTTFIAPTADKDATTALAAFDLSSGKKLWQSPPAPTGPVIIAAQDPQKVTVFEAGAPGSSPRLTAFAMSDGGNLAAGINGTIATDWSGPAAAAYVTGDRLIVLPAAPEKGADVVAFALSNTG
ncbi:outer membrane protein assembly factor BamB [Catenulispora sp. MAP12-49]|uniref:outer membrane protein assembly factor BamB family protein n=1 Tax=unclassified Catenulispora TaxID=414885 RepID=UPI0035182CA2